MNSIEKSIMRIRNKAGSFFVPLCTFVASIVYTFLTNHIISTFNTGYLYHFKINVNYPIESVLSHSKMMLFIFITIIVIFTTTAVYVLNHFLIKDKINCLFSIKSITQFFILFIVSYVMLFFLLFFMFAYVLFINDHISLWITFLALLNIKSFWLTALILSTYIVIVSIYLFVNNKNSQSSQNNVNSVIIYNKLLQFDKKIADSIFLLISLVILGISIFVIDYSALELGKSSASMEHSYPSFTKNEIEYLVIAKSYDNNFLAIDVNSLQEETVNCIILDIEGYELKNKLNSELPLD